MPFKGYKQTKEHSEKISLYLSGRKRPEVAGAKSNFWQGGYYNKPLNYRMLHR